MGCLATHATRKHNNYCIEARSYHNLSKGTKNRNNDTGLLFVSQTLGKRTENEIDSISMDVVDNLH